MVDQGQEVPTLPDAWSATASFIGPNACASAPLSPGDVEVERGEVGGVEKTGGSIPSMGMNSKPRQDDGILSIAAIRLARSAASSIDSPETGI